MHHHAQEIDNLFLAADEEAHDSNRISHLREYINSVPRISPYLEFIHEEARTLQKAFLVYDIRLSILSHDLTQIQEKNRSIAVKSKHEETLFKALRDLCVVLTLDEEHTQVLESVSFTDPEDLAKMERALSVLGSIDLKKYKIRVAQEKCNEIIEGERHFLKRFMIFLNKLFVRSESTGELCIHRALYDAMLRYRSIYTFSKRFPDYYSILCSAYVRHAKKLYEEEFETHISSVSSLMSSSQKVAACIKVLLKSHESLVGCESSFMVRMEIESDVEEVFKNVNGVILEFLDGAAEKSRITTILALREFLSGPPPALQSLKSFRLETQRRCELFEEHFARAEESRPVSSRSISFLNQLGDYPEVSHFYDRMLKLYIGKLSENLKGSPAEDVVGRHVLLNTVKSTSSQKKDALALFEECFYQKIIERVFEDADVAGAAEGLIRSVDLNCSGGNETLRVLRQVVLEHADEADLPALEKAFSSVVPKKSN